MNGKLKKTTQILELIGNSNNRKIFYTSIVTDKDWFGNLPTDNWLAFPIGDTKDVEIYSKLADKCIDNDVLYVCAAGQYCELIHDIFDETIVAKQMEKEDESTRSSNDVEDSPMTTWHTNFSEGFWFAIITAYHELKSIDKIVCIDFTTKGVKNHLINLIDKINSHWLPSHEKYEEPIYDK
ncbi:MAG: hypothetical protein WBP45_01575 [Daejeonella sp.]